MALEFNSIDMTAWDSILIHVIAEKLDGKRGRYWELETLVISMQEYKELMEFLANTARALEASSRHINHKAANTNKNSQPQSRGTTPSPDCQYQESLFQMLTRGCLKPLGGGYTNLPSLYYTPTNFKIPQPSRLQ